MRTAVGMLAIAGVAVGVMSEILVGSISEAAADDRAVASSSSASIVVAIVGNAAEHWVAVLVARKDKMDLVGQHRDRLERPDRAVRRAGARAASFVIGPLPMALVFNGFELGGAAPRGADRQPGHPGRRVDLVRGRPAARGLRRPRPSPSSSPDVTAAAPVAARAIAADRRDRRRCCSSTCCCSRAAASRRSARASVWSIGWLVLVAARRDAIAAGARRRPRRRQLHDGLPDRAHALARQPVRLPAALRLLRRCPSQQRGGLLFWGIVLALVLRGVAILGGVAADRALPRRHLHPRRARCSSSPGGCAKGSAEHADPGPQPVVRLRAARLAGTSDYEGAHCFVRRDGRRFVTPMALAWRRSSPRTSRSRSTRSRRRSRSRATRSLIWTANVFALLGLRALFVLVEELIKRFRYLNQTIAIVLAHRRGQAADRGPLERPGARSAWRLRRSGSFAARRSCSSMPRRPTGLSPSSRAGGRPRPRRRAAACPALAARVAGDHEVADLGSPARGRRPAA